MQKTILIKDNSRGYIIAPLSELDYQKLMYIFDNPVTHKKGKNIELQAFVTRYFAASIEMGITIAIEKHKKDIIDGILFSKEQTISDIDSYVQTGYERIYHMQGFHQKMNRLPNENDHIMLVVHPVFYMNIDERLMQNGMYEITIRSLVNYINI